MSDKFAIQDGQYEFPYHHIPHFRGGAPSTIRSLNWGLEYLCYLRLLAERVMELAPASVLDVGCGDGRLLGLLDAPVRHGVDLSAAAIRFARAFHPDVTFEVIDDEAVDAEFDVVTSIETLEHIPDDGTEGFLRALAARARPDGHVLISVPTTVVALNAKHYRHYDLALLQQQVAASGAPLVLEREEYVYRHSRLLKALRRATVNRLWTVEIPAVQELAWRYVQRRVRSATAADGHHLVARYRLA